MLVELYTETFLVRAGVKLGTMLKIDQNTSIHSRGKFARICVEINLRRKLVPAILVLGREFKVEYEGLHLICFNCGQYGHRMEICMETVVAPAKTAEVATVEANMEGMEGENLPLDQGSRNQGIVMLNEENQERISQSNINAD